MPNNSNRNSASSLSLSSTSKADGKHYAYSLLSWPALISEVPGLKANPSSELFFPGASEAHNEIMDCVGAVKRFHMTYVVKMHGVGGMA